MKRCEHGSNIRHCSECTKGVRRFTFRGLVILYYDNNSEEVTVTENFKKCNFIAEDYLLIANFFDTIYKLKTGIPVTELELEDINV